MTKQIHFFLIALFTLQCFSVFGQELENTHNNIGFKHNTGGKRVKLYNYNSTNAVLFHGNGTIELYDWADDNTLSEDPSIVINAPEYQKREIDITGGGNVLTFYKALNDDGTPIIGYFDYEMISGHDFPTVLVSHSETDPSFNNEIWVTELNGYYLYYVFIDNKVDSKQGFYIIECDVNVDLTNTTDRVGPEFDGFILTSADVIDTSFPIQDDIDLFANNVIIDNTGDLIVSDPAYNLHKGRVVRYDIGNYPTLYNFNFTLGDGTPSNTDYSDFLIQGSTSEVVFNSKIPAFISDIYSGSPQFHSDEIFEFSGENESEFISVDTVYSSNIQLTNGNSAILSKKYTSKSDGSERIDLFLYKIYFGPDNIPFLSEYTINNTESYSKIFDIESSNEYVFISGIRNGNEYLDAYKISTAKDSFNKTSSVTYSTATSESYNPIEIFNNNLIALLNRKEGRVYIHDYGLAPLGDHLFDTDYTMDKTSFGADYFLYNNNFIFSTPNEGGSIFRLAFETIDGAENSESDGLWSTSSNWMYDNVPLPNNGNIDNSTVVNINNDITSKGMYHEYTFELNKLTVTEGASLIIAPEDINNMNSFNIGTLEIQSTSENPSTFSTNKSGDINIDNIIDTESAITTIEGNTIIINNSFTSSGTINVIASTDGTPSNLDISSTTTNTFNGHITLSESGMSVDSEFTNNGILDVTNGSTIYFNQKFTNQGADGDKFSISSSEAYFYGEVINNYEFQVDNSGIFINGDFTNNHSLTNNEGSTFIFNNSTKTLTLDFDEYLYNIELEGDSKNSFDFVNGIKVKSLLQFSDNFNLTGNNITFGESDEDIIELRGSTYISLIINNIIVNGNTNVNSYLSDDSEITVLENFTLNNQFDFDNNYFEIYIGDKTGNGIQGQIISNNNGFISGNDVYINYFIKPTNNSNVTLNFPQLIQNTYDPNESGDLIDASISLELSNLDTDMKVGEITIYPESTSPEIITKDDKTYGVFKDIAWDIWHISNLESYDLDITFSTSDFISYPINNLSTLLKVNDDILAITTNTDKATNSISLPVPGGLSSMYISVLSNDIERTFESISDGDWDNPFTWDKYEVPSEYDHVIVKHQVNSFPLGGIIGGQIGGTIGMMTTGGVDDSKGGSITSNEVLDIHITSRDEGGETAYGELTIAGFEDTPNILETGYIVIDDGCSLNQGPESYITSSNEGDVKDIINGNITLYDAHFFSGNNITLNGQIIDNGVEDGYISEFITQGTEISGIGDISVSSFLIAEDGDGDNRIVNINVPLNINNSSGSLDSEGPLTINFNDLVTFEEGSLINTMGYVTFKGSTDDQEDELYIDVVEGTEDENFISLTINDYNHIEFSHATSFSTDLIISNQEGETSDLFINKNLTVKNQFELNNITNVNINDDVSIIVNPTEDGKVAVDGLEPLVFNNIANITGVDNTSIIKVKLDNDASNQIKPQILNTSFSNINFTGDSVFLIKPTTLSSLSGNYIELVKDPELLNKVVYDEIEDQNFIDTRVSPKDDSVRFLVTIPTDGSNRVLHDDEDLVIKFGTSEITDFKIGDVKTISGEVSVTYNWVGIPISELQRVNVDFTGNSFDLSVATKHKTFDDQVSNATTISFQIIPENYIIDEDLALLKTFIGNLEYNVGDLQSNFSISADDLNNLTNAYTTNSFLDNVTDINNYGRIIALNLENKNISTFAVADLQPSSGGFFPPLDEGIPSITITGMENLVELRLDGNHLDFNDTDLSTDSYNVIYNPLTPYINKTSYTSTLTVGGLNSYTFDDQYGGKVYHWYRQDKNDADIFLELTYFGGNTLPLTNIDSAGTYKVVLENAESVIDLQLEFLVDITILQGESEKTALENFLVENGKSADFDPSDNMRDWFSTETRFVIDDYGRVEQMDLSYFDLQSVVGLLESGSPRFSSSLTNIDVSNNYILFDNIDALTIDAQNYSSLSLTIGHQDYIDFNSNIDNEELILGDPAYTSSIDYSAFYSGDLSNLVYKWYKDDSRTITPAVENASNQIVIDPTDNSIEGRYQLKLGHINYSGTNILIKEINITSSLGAQDSASLKKILEDIDPALDLSGEMRSWLSNEEVNINSYGQVLKLDLSNRNISSLISDFGNLSYLTDLNLSNNSISDISVLSSLSNLVNIDLSYNQLTDITALSSISGIDNLNISYNKLYFNQILLFTSAGLSQYNYSNQAYDKTVSTQDVEHGTIDFAFDGQIANDENLTYQWVRQSDAEIVSNTPSFAINPMTINDEDTYILSVQHDNVSDLWIDIHQFDVNHVLGTADKDELSTLLTELGVDTESTEDMRLWDQDENIVVIDSAGYVTSIDISGKSLTTLPSNINNFSNLEILDISNNQLYFDQIIAITYTDLDEFNYLNQSYNVVQNSRDVEHGTTDFTFDGAIANDENLTYQWVRQSDAEIVSNTSSFAINPMTINDEDTYILSVQHDNVSDLWIDIHQFDVNHVLGTADKDELSTLLTELGIDTESTEDMRLWDQDENIVVIDSAGYVTSIDISGKSLTTLPSNINNFSNLEILDISNNQLYFDQIIAITYTDLDEFNYLNQSYNVIQDSRDLEHGTTDFTFDGAIANDENLTYQWVRQSDAEIVSNTSSFAISPMTINDEDTYILSVQHNNVSDLWIDIHQFDVNHVLGTADKDELKTLLTELGIDTESTEDMRLWDQEENIVVIDSAGYVISIDVSGKSLTSLPSNINNFNNLETLNISNNQLYFDQIIAITYTDLDEFNYLNQSYNVIQDSRDLEHGTTDFTFDGAIANDENLTYQWVRQSDAEIVSNTSSFAISPMTINDEDTYILSVQHNNVSDLWIDIHQFDVNHVLGTADKDELKTLLTELGIDTESTEDMRLWDQEENIVIIDSAGYVTTIDISNRALTALPSNINNFSNLEILDISNNQLYFDQIIAITYTDLDEFNYLNQSYNVVQNSRDVEHGTTDFTFDGAIANDENLTYQWVRQSDAEIVSNTSSFAINPMTINDEDTYILSVQHDNVSDLWIDIHQFDVNHVLGTADKDELSTLLTELGIDTESTEDMRLWDQDENIVVIDSAGYVTSIDISGKSLTTLPSNINNFSNLEILDISNNQLYFDQIIAITYTDLDEFNYLNQSYNVVQDSRDVEHGTTDFAFDGQISNDENLTYQWVRQGDAEIVSNTSSFAISPMTINDEDTYILSVQHDNVSDLWIDIHQFDVNHVLGTADKDELKTLLTELGVDTESTEDMRLWDQDENIVVIDSAGYVTSIDISGKSLTTLPSNINNFSNLEILDISNNQLYFDQIIAITYTDLDEFNYLNQSYNVVRDSKDVEHGTTDFSFDGAIENDEDLTYKWTLLTNEVSSSSSFAIASMTHENAGSYILSVKHNDVENLWIDIHQFDVNYVLGTAEETELKELLTDLGINTDDEDMRQWDPNEEIVSIDEEGYITRIDISDRDLDSIPSVENFDNLDTLDVSDNNLFFDDILVYINESFEYNFDNQSYSLIQSNKEIEHGTTDFSFNSAIENDENLNYTWTKAGTEISSTSVFAIDYMTPDNAGTYILSLSHNSIADFSIEIHQYDISYTLGTVDKEALKDLLTDLGINTDNDDMRQWDPEQEVISINDEGYVTRIDLSNKGLDSIPTILNNFDQLDSIDVSNNNLFFDDINPYLEYNITYTNQTFAYTNKSDTLTYGENFNYDGVIDGFDTLKYVWKKNDGTQISDNSILKIDFATGDSTGLLNLFASSTAIEDLEIQVDEFALSYTLGNEDSVLLQKMLVEIGYTDYSSNKNFRTWLSDRVDIDNYGRVTSLDLSNFSINGNLLNSLPSELLNFNYLTAIQVQGNTLDFNDLNGFESIEDKLTYTPQTVETFEENYFVTQYDNFEKTIEIEENSKVSWVHNNDTTELSNDGMFKVSSFDASKEGKYTFISQSDDNNWGDLTITLGTISLNYQSLISEADSTALYELFTAMNIEFDESIRIIDWPRIEYNVSGEITAIFLHELEGVTELPDIIGRFDDLETLKLYDSNISTISDSLWTISNLEYLDLSNNNLEDNDVLGVEKLSSLTTLWLSINHLTMVPPIQNNSQLRYFIADDNDIVNISNEFNNLNSLLDLSLAGNALESISTNFTQLTSLKKVDLSRNNLTTWSYSLPSSVEELILYSNMLTTLEQVPNDIYVNVADNFLFFNDLEGYDKTFLNYSPQRYNIHYENVGMTEGETYVFNLPIDKTDELVYMWFKDGVILSDINADSLKVEDMKNSDAGVYTCYISNVYWDELSIQVAQISLGMDCGEDFTVNLQSNTNEWFCYGEDIEVQIEAVSSNSNLVYNWYKGDELLSLLNSAVITVHEEGMYSVKVQNANGCITFSDSLEVKVTAPLVAPSIIENGDSLTLDSIDDNLQYFWYINGELQNQSGVSIAKLKAGNYSVEVVNEAGCNTFTSDYTVDPSGIVTDLEDELELISLFPQPANNVLNIQKDNRSILIESIQFIDISGKTTQVEYSDNSSTIEVSTNTLKSGMYVLEIAEKNGHVSYHKIMIAH